jgi:mersacidin/lichenicidin family type 2 lantibiotic
MDDQDLVRAWKEPEARQEATADHPAGEIKLDSASTLSRRIGLLSGWVATGVALAAVLDFPVFTTTQSPNIIV